MSPHYNRAKNESNTQQLAKALIESAAARPNQAMGNLRKETGKNVYHDTMLQEPLAKKEQMGGNLEQGLSHIIVVGDTVLGVSRTVNMKKLGQPDAVEQIRLAVLPLGEQGSDTGSSRTIVTMQASALRQPRHNGVMQPWESVRLGRSELAALTGHTDPTVSGTHLEIAFSADGSVGVYDFESTNGTQIYNATDLSSTFTVSDGGRSSLAALAVELQQNPHMWDAESADRTVINPY